VPVGDNSDKRLSRGKKGKPDKPKSPRGHTEKPVSDTSNSEHETRKGHVRNKSWTTSIRETSKRNKIDIQTHQQPSNETLNDGNRPVQERAAVSPRPSVMILAQVPSNPRSNFTPFGSRALISSLNSNSSSPAISPRTSLSRAGSNPGSASNSPRSPVPSPPPSGTRPPFPTQKSASAIVTTPAYRSAEFIPPVSAPAPKSSGGRLDSSVSVPCLPISKLPQSLPNTPITSPSGKRQPPPIPPKSSKPAVLLSNLPETLNT